MINATVGILTLNSSKTIYRCLNSVKEFNEIIVIDGGSIDSTLNIAKKFKCKILKQEKLLKFKNKKIRDFSALRNKIINNAKYDIVLMIDSDEILNINNLNFLNFLTKSKSQRKKNYCYLIPRVPIIDNISYFKSNLFPEYQPRLFNKSNILRFIKNVHETPIPINSKLKKQKIDSIQIKFNVSFSQNKFKYYLIIEKLMLKKNFIHSMKFIFIRFLVNLKKIYKCLFFNKSKPKIKEYEIFLIKNNLKYALKLLLYKFKII